MCETKSWGEHQGKVIDSVNRFDVIECQACGFKHVIPVVTVEETEEYYSKQFLEDSNLSHGIIPADGG